MSKELLYEDFKEIEVVPVSAGKFSVARPEDQLGLTIEMEAGAIPEKYLNRYHTDHDVTCAFCPSHTPHRRGFTVEMKDGRIGLCGIDCAKKYFGTDVAKGFEDILNKTEYEVQRDAILARAIEKLPDIYDAIRHQWIPLENEIDEILRVMPDLRHKMRRQDLTDNGDFIIKDVQVEWREVQNGHKLAFEVERQVGRIVRAELLFMSGSRFRSAAVTAKEVMTGKDMRHAQLSTDRRFKARNALIQRLRDAIRYVEYAKLFFTEENMKCLDRANRIINGDGAKYEWKKGRPNGVLAFRNEFKETTKYALPDFSSMPNEMDLVDPLNLRH
jgi:hypothetical protein